MTSPMSSVSSLWTWAEGLSVAEYAWFSALRPLLNKLPRGDNQPVLVLPGFATGDESTWSLRDLLRDLGYRTYRSKLGINLGFDTETAAELHERLRTIHRQTKQPVSVIGWSLGGVFAFELANTQPKAVRQIITLGSPVADVEIPKKTPCTSIYSRTDGVVAWRDARHRSRPERITENICVPATHTGLAVNPAAVFALADRLAQPRKNWRPFDKTGLRSVIYSGDWYV